MTARQAFVTELRRQFAYAGRPLVIQPGDIQRSKTADAWFARVQTKAGSNKHSPLLLTSHQTVEQCLRGFSLEWVSQFHVVIHGHGG